MTKSGLQDPVNLGNIDAARLRIDFSASLSQPKPGAYNASVILKSAGGIVASRSFVINVSGFGGVVSDPAAATAWLRAHHGIATDFEVQLHTDFVENAGSNAVTFEVRYDNAAATGWSHAWYSGIGGPCDGCQVY